MVFVYSPHACDSSKLFCGPGEAYIMADMGSGGISHNSAQCPFYQEGYFPK